MSPDPTPATSTLASQNVRSRSPPSPAHRAAIAAAHSTPPGRTAHRWPTRSDNRPASIDITPVDKNTGVDNSPASRIE